MWSLSIILFDTSNSEIYQTYTYCLNYTMGRRGGISSMWSFNQHDVYHNIPILGRDNYNMRTAMTTKPHEFHIVHNKL